jgi:hypothetical protein
MSEDRGAMEEHVEAEAARDAYLTPALTDLGSFQELTQLGGSQTIDAEGQS